MNDRKILILAFFLILISFFSFNYSKITGNVVSEDFVSSLSVNPKSLDSGDVISIKIIPGQAGVDSEIKFYRASGELRISTLSANVCKYSKCYEKSVINKRVYLDSGSYYVWIKDVYTDRPIMAQFTIN